MRVEQRDVGHRIGLLPNSQEDEEMNQGKVFEIPKALVWQSYQQVRQNGGSAGCDGQTLQKFEENRDRNLYKIWNRLSSGSYFPSPVLEKAIPKGDGKERLLGIPTVADRVAQGAVKIYLERLLDPKFDEDSYGYRPNKSAHDALEKCKRRCWQHGWVLEIDIQSFFDCVRHDLVLKALELHQVPPWVTLYCRRWLEAPSVRSQGQETPTRRTLGTPQGGVISPLLANLFLHYAFDRWIRRKHVGVPFERYADDIVCHCDTMKQALNLRRELEKRMQEVGLKLHPDKTQVVYVDTFKRWNVKTSFSFLGYDFTLRTVKSPRTGKLARKCMPGASKKAMKRITQTVRDWRLHRAAGQDAAQLAKRYNAEIRGWITYYGKHWYRNFSYRLWSVLQSRLLKWVQAKYRLGFRAAAHWLSQLKKKSPNLFVHWYLLRAPNT